MQPINMIEYTIRVKEKILKISLPKFVTDWDAVYELVLKEAYDKRLWDKTDFECEGTREYEDPIAL